MTATATPALRMSSSARAVPPSDLADLVDTYHADPDPRVAEEILSLIEPLLRSRVRKMTRPGVEVEDLMQVARMAAVKALQRWSPDGGAAYTTFAVRYVDGTLRRYYRDHGWDVHVPRSSKEASLRVVRFRRHFLRDHGRDPSLSELADASGMTVQEVAHALETANAYTSQSLNAPTGESGTELGDLLGDDGPPLDPEAAMDVRQAIGELPERLRLIMYYRFYQGLTQSEIAERVGCSQMHVSRLIRRGLKQLRAHLEGEAAEALTA